MIPSVRRVVASSAAAPPAAAALVRSTAVQIQPGQTIHQSRGQQPQQRRYSSSKPSSPDNGSKALPGVPSTPSNSSSSSSSSSNSSSSFKRKRKAKQDASRPSVQKLPSVPSTQHLPVESLALSTFFSQHRPISITHSLPKVVTEDAFAAIFAPRAGRGKSSEVIRTLSRAVNDLEGPMASLSVNDANSTTAQPAQRGSRARQAKEQAQFARQQLQQQLEEDAAATNADGNSASSSQQLEFKNADGSDAGIYVQLNALSGQFLPFQPPPPPIPEMTEAEAAAVEAAEGESNSASASASSLSAQDTITFELDGSELSSTGNSAAALEEDAESRSTRVFKAILTIEEHLDENGEVRIVAHSPQILEEGAENALQQQRQRGGLRRTRPAPMEALSVVRRRKLRMKKKKYKKLMKRTRMERRKLDRT